MRAYRTPEPGDPALLWHEGSIPIRATITGVSDGRITRVSMDEPGTWGTAAPGEFTVDGREQANWDQWAVLYDCTGR